MNDTIYRRDAIDAINALHEKPNAWLDSAVDAVMTLPSAQPERMCNGCRYERHGSVVCDSCSRFFLDRYEVDSNE